MHLLVVWYLVNLQDARCNSKDTYMALFKSGSDTLLVSCVGGRVATALHRRTNE